MRREIEDGRALLAGCPDAGFGDVEELVKSAERWVVAGVEGKFEDGRCFGGGHCWCHFVCYSGAFARCLNV